MAKKFVSIKDAFNLGYKRFFSGHSDYDFPFELDFLPQREFLRGWNAAYFNNLERVKSDEKKNKKPLRIYVST